MTTYKVVTIVSKKVLSQNNFEHCHWFNKYLLQLARGNNHLVAIWWQTIKIE